MRADISLTVTKRTDLRLLKRMINHYSQPKGFVGRNICYAIEFENQYYGHIIAGSATRFLPGRNEFLEMSLSDLNCVANNIFFNIAPLPKRKYPLRNFASVVLKSFVTRVAFDWWEKYGDKLLGFESLVELPREGTCYLRAGWTEVGETQGRTCKRISGKSSDSWSGRRVWARAEEPLKPKRVFCYKL